VRVAFGCVTATALYACDAPVHIKLLPLESQGTDSESQGADTTVVSNADESSMVDSGTRTSASPAIDAGALLETTLLHHYDFVGDGTLLPDLVGEADGQVVGGTVLVPNGALELDGVDDFVNLPNGMISTLPAATITLWVLWRGGECWQRLFDFGSSATGEDTASSAITSLFVSPASCRWSHLGEVEPKMPTLMFHAPNGYLVEQDVNQLPSDVPVFVSLSVGSDGALRLSLNAETVVQLKTGLRLSDLDDVNNWVGRSQWKADATLKATLFDLRIFGAALTEEHVRTLFERTKDEF
jgi:hypothetical protein